MRDERGTDAECLVGKQKGSSKYGHWGQPAHLFSLGEALPHAPPGLVASSVQNQGPWMGRH